VILFVSGATATVRKWRQVGEARYLKRRAERKSRLREGHTDSGNMDYPPG
jgi:hypothetical protein